MIQFRSQNFIDYRKYDACVQRDESSLPYALSWYLNTVCEQWDCLVLNDYDAVWPLPWRRKFGLKYYFRPYGLQQLGIFSKKPLSQDQVNEFIQHLPKKVLFADIYLNESQFGQIKKLPSKVLISSQLNLKLDIGHSYEQTYQGFNTNLKRKLKKSEANKLQLFEGEGPEALLRLFKENQGQRLELDEEFYRAFKALMFQLMHKGLTKIYTVYGGPNQLLAAALFLEYGERSIFLFSASSEMGKELNAMAYLINEYLIFQSGKFRFLDFEGSNQKGLAQFYKSFGAKEFYYPNLYVNRIPWPFNRLK